MNTKKIPSIGGVGLMAGALACAGLLSAGVAGVRGSAAYTQGFEQNTNGWVFGTQYAGSGNYGITRYQSGSNASPVGAINAASGNYYAVVNNATNNYSNSGAASAGYGDAGFAVLGPNNATYPGAFTQSMSIYVNTSWAAPANSSTSAFWLDGAPSASTATGNGGVPLFGGAGYGGVGVGSAENDFAFFTTGAGSVTVAADNNPANYTIATISSTGWYKFSMAFSQGSDGNVHETLSIFDNAGNLLASETPQTFDYTSIPNADLGGPGYLWLTVWQNGFAGNNLAIDNVFPVVTPVPGSGFLAAVGGLALIGGMALRRRMAKLQ